MKYKYQYATEEEKQTLITNNADKKIEEIANIAEGNFITFADAIPETPIQPIEIADKIIDIENTLDILLLKQEGIL